MEPVVIFVNGLMLDALLIREANPRLVVCQDRVAQLDNHNNVIKSIDLLPLFNTSEIDELDIDPYGGNIQP